MRTNKQAKASLSQGRIQDRSIQRTTQQQLVNRSGSHCDQPRQSRRPLVSMKGARKVWNTFKFVTASAVSHAVHTITGIPTTNLSIKRKFRHCAVSNKVSTWWFVIRGEETVLEQLESMWSQVQLQTKWELKSLLSYSDAEADPESGGQPSNNPKPDESTVASLEGANSGDKPLVTTPSSFCQTQSPTPET